MANSTRCGGKHVPTALSRQMKSRATYYEYNALGQRTVITDANWQVTRFSYDGVNPF